MWPKRDIWRILRTAGVRHFTDSWRTRPQRGRRGRKKVAALRSAAEDSLQLPLCGNGEEVVFFWLEPLEDPRQPSQEVSFLETTREGTGGYLAAP